MDPISILTILIPTGLGFFSTVWGIHVYREEEKLKREEQKLKRKELLFPLVEELRTSGDLESAELLLDDKVIRREKKWKKSVDAYDIVWDEIQGDYRPLKHLLDEAGGFDWVKNQSFVKSEDDNIVMIQDENHFLSIIRNEKLPYHVDVETLDKIIGIENKKYRYRYVHYFYADIIDKRANKLGYYYHKSGLKYILRKHSMDPIMDNDEDQIRKSFNSLFGFWERIGYLDEGLGFFGNKELNFFLERMKKLLDNGAIKDYVEYYGFRLAL